MEGFFGSKVPIDRNDIGSDQCRRRLHFEEDEIVPQQERYTVAFSYPHCVQPARRPPRALRKLRPRQLAVSADDSSCHGRATMASPARV